MKILTLAALASLAPGCFDVGSLGPPPGTDAATSSENDASPSDDAVSPDAEAASDLALPSGLPPGYAALLVAFLVAGVFFGFRGLAFIDRVLAARPQQPTEDR